MRNYEELVSVIVPMYNAETSISKTIDSILNQTYKEVEIIIVDDISNDKSPQIVAEYISNNTNIFYHKLDEKGGASIARNKAIELSNGKYIAFLDADDTWKQDKLSRQIRFMKDNGYFFTYCNFDIVDDQGNYIKTSSSPSVINYKSLMKYNSIGCLTVVYDKEKYPGLNIPRLDKRNDYALWLKALRMGGEGHLIEESLAVYAKQSNSLSRSKPKYDLLKYHFQLFYEVLGYNSIASVFYTIRNAVFSQINR